MRAIRVHEYGAADVMRWEDLPQPQPGPAELRVRLSAVGLNFIDTYQRSGLYRLPLPFIPGNEGAGVVDAVGEGVTSFQPGDRVAYTGVQGAYAEYSIVPLDQAVRVPEGLEIHQAGAAMLQGMTAHYLCHHTYPLQGAESCLIHAGAGGVGLLLIQMCRMIGAEIYTTVSTEEKAALAREAGANHVILYTQQDFAEEVLRISGGRKLDVIYDSVARDTFDKGLEILRPRGMMVLYGQSSGVVPPLDLNRLSVAGSLFITRPRLGAYTATREELEQRAGDVLGWVLEGRLKLRIGARYPLADAVEAHRAIEGRSTTGKVLLLP